MKANSVFLEEFIPKAEVVDFDGSQSYSWENHPIVMSAIVQKNIAGYCIYDYAALRYIDFSEPLANDLGMKRNDLLAHGHNLIFERFHPDDLAFYPKKINFIMTEVFPHLTEEQKLNFVGRASYRLYNGNGYVALMATIIFLKLDTQGKVHLELDIISTFKPDEKSFCSSIAYSYPNPDGTFTYAHFSNETKQVTDPKPVHPFITRQEHKVYQLLKEGLSSKEIAEKLFVSVNTINTHRKSLLRKFNVHKLTSLIKILE